MPGLLCLIKASLGVLFWFEFIGAARSYIANPTAANRRVLIIGIR
jgi:hypothetical protein